MKILLLLSLGLLAGCGTLIGSIARGGERTSSRPEESDAELSCAGKPCAEAALSRRGPRTPATGGFIAGSIVDLAIIGAGAYAVNKTGNAGSGALLTAGIAFLLADAAVLGSSKHEPPEPWRLNEPVTASWRGQRVNLEASDLLLGGAVRPAFSVAALVKLSICSADSPIPRELESLTLFDAVSSTRALRPESIRYLTEIARVRIGELFPNCG
jgi:hypothetical protein